MFAVAADVECAGAHEVYLSLAEERTFLLIGLFCIRCAITQRIGGATGYFQKERLAALVVDGRSVLIGDADTIEFDAELLLAIDNQRPVSGGTTQDE